MAVTEAQAAAFAAQLKEYTDSRIKRGEAFRKASAPRDLVAEGTRSHLAAEERA